MEIAVAIFHGLGDCTNATSLLKPISDKYKGHDIIWITAEKYAPLVENNPYISKIIRISGNPYAADKKYNELKKKYKKLITPAPYLNPLSKNKILVESFKERAKAIGGKDYNIQPLLYMTKREVDKAKKWLSNNNMDKYVMLETKFTSHQSSWAKKHTKLAIEKLADKGYNVLLTHQNDKLLTEYNKITKTMCMDFNFRYAPAFYNNSSGFIGVSSGISCICHTHQCRKDLPHLEFVRGEHWCTRLYPKQNKTIKFKMGQLETLIAAKF